MARKDSRPADGRPRRDRRPGRAGTGPGPAYRPSSTGGGTTHKPPGSSRPPAQMMAPVYALAAFVVLTVGGVAAFLVHGYGIV